MSKDLQPRRPRREPEILRMTIGAARVRPPEVAPMETWTDTRYKLLERIRTAERRGEVATVGSWRRVPGWDGVYSVRVQRLRQPAPRWRRLTLIGLGVVAVLTGLLVAGYFIVSAIIGYVLMILGAATAVGGVLLLAAGAGGGGGTVEVLQRVIIRR